MAGNAATAAVKYIAAWWTGSSAMLSEAIHSTIDTSNELLLLFGMHRASRPPDRSHPFGYGMEFYFWSFVVALLIFAFGGALSIYEGIDKIRHPESIADVWINFFVLGPCIAFEAFTFRVAWRELRARAPTLRPWAAIRASKDPSVFAILLEDAAALTGLAIAGLGLALMLLLDLPIMDGLASIGIGITLVLTSIVLAREVLSLMTGESASRITLDQARSILTADKRVKAIQELLSLHLGPQDILLAVSIDFDDNLTSPEIEAAARDLSDKLQSADMGITRVFLRPVEEAEQPSHPVKVG